MYKLLLFSLLASPLFFAQKYKPFQGKLVYSIENEDTSLRKLYPTKFMTIYTNDTIVRIENVSDQLGKQVVIKHTILNKSILLLQARNQYYAIQTDLNSSKNDSIQKENDANILYKKKFGKKTITGLKAKKIIITDQKNKKNIDLYYLKKYSNKYIDAYSKSPGLPIKYSIITEDGVFVYTLISMEEAVLNHDLFGVPSNYKRVSFAQFLDEVLQK